MSRNTDTIHRYLDGFRTGDREQILGCLHDEVEWTVFGWYHVTGKDGYAEHLTEGGFTGPPELDVVRLVEQDDVVMGEIVGRARRDDGTEVRMSMAEVWGMRDGLIRDRRSWVVVLEKDDWT